MNYVIISLSILTLILVIVISILIYYIVQYDNQNDNCQITNNELQEKYQKVKNEKDKLLRIVHVDQDIFNYIRCLNIPRAPVCRTVHGKQICRSMQMNCDKFKNLLETDSDAKHRMKRATDQYFDSYQVKDLNGLSQPVNSGWMF